MPQGGEGRFAARKEWDCDAHSPTPSVVYDRCIPKKIIRRASFTGFKIPVAVYNGARYA